MKQVPREFEGKIVPECIERLGFDFISDSLASHGQCAYLAIKKESCKDSKSGCSSYCLIGKENQKNLQKLKDYVMSEDDNQITFPREMLFRGNVVTVYGTSVYDSDQFVFEDGDICDATCKSSFKELPKQKQLRPMTHAEVNKWWNDAVRSGNNPATKNSINNAVLFNLPNINVAPNFNNYSFCKNYTGTSSDKWIRLEVECD